MSDDSKELEAVLENLATNIRTLRTHRGLSQKELADAIGCDHTHVSRLETIQRIASLDLLGRMAKVLGVEVADLLAPIEMSFRRGAE